MFHSGQCGRLRETQLADSNADASSVVARRVGRPGRNPEYPRGFTALRRPIAARARAASDDELRDCAFAVRAARFAECLELRANLSPIDRRDREPCGAGYEPVEVVVEMADAAGFYGHR